MGALLALIPLKDWLYAGILIVVLAFSVHEYHAIEAKGAAQETAAIVAAGAKATAAANAKIAQLNQDYSAAMVATGKTYAKAMQDASTSDAADLQRLRQRAASDSAARGVLGGASGSSAASGAGDEGFSGLGSVAFGLNTALRADDAALAQCYADRDSLTGK